MSNRLAAHLPRAITNLSSRARSAIGVAVATPLLLFGLLGLGRPATRPDSGLAGCTSISTTHGLTARDFREIRALFAASHWPRLRAAGIAYADLLSQLRTARGTDGYEAVWFYQRLSAACAVHRASR